MQKLDVAACAQVSVLDGNKYTTMCREAGEQCLEILEECTVHPRADPCQTALLQHPRNKQLALL